MMINDDSATAYFLMALDSTAVPDFITLHFALLDFNDVWSF